MIRILLMELPLQVATRRHRSWWCKKYGKQASSRCETNKRFEEQCKGSRDMVDIGSWMCKMKEIKGQHRGARQGEHNKLQHRDRKNSIQSCKAKAQDKTQDRIQQTCDIRFHKVASQRYIAYKSHRNRRRMTHPRAYDWFTSDLRSKKYGDIASYGIKSCKQKLHLRGARLARGHKFR